MLLGPVNQRLNQPNHRGNRGHGQQREKHDADQVSAWHLRQRLRVGDKGEAGALQPQLLPRQPLPQAGDCVLQGSTETTFYVLAVYFGAVGVTRARHAVAAGLTADLVGVLAGTAICAALFGHLM